METLKSLTQQLIPPALPEVFKKTYYFLYSNSNLPRAEKLSNEMIKLLFCKIYDELNKKNVFRTHEKEKEEETEEKIKKLFEEVKEKYSDVFNKNEKIRLDRKSIKAVVAFLQNYVLTNTERDAISEAFQAFLGPGLRGEKGQFFTPKNVVKTCIKTLNPKPGEKVIDPACGSGGFLIEVLFHLKGKHVSNVFGIDKEIDLVKICKAYVAIVGNGHPNVFCADSLNPESWPEDVKEKVRDSFFDVVVTNPPFGAKIRVEDEKILKNFKLARKWVKNKNGSWKMSNKVIKQVPQVLFVERCLQLLKPGGRMAIVLPDGLFGNPSNGYVWEYVLNEAKVLAIVSLPPETFLPSTHTKTSVLFLEKKKSKKEEDYPIFMAIAEKVGHDKNGKIIFKMDKNGRYVLDEMGRKIIDDDLPTITHKYLEYLSSGKLEKSDRFGFVVKLSQIKNNVFVPSYYDPEVKTELANLEKSGKYKLTSIGELEKRKIISIKRGHEVGSKYYGLGSVPFVRTSDVVNWEIKIDPVKCIPEEIYEKYKNKQDVKEWDVLLVTDGTFLIGRTAIVTPLDKKIVIQSHIRRIRCLKPDLLHPFLLLYLLNTPIVQKQIKEKTFVQATISTIGNRLKEIILPIPVDESQKNKIIEEVRYVIELKMKAKKKMDELLNNEKL